MKNWQPIDRLFVGIIVVFIVLAAILWACTPTKADAQMQSFTVDFSNPVDVLQKMIDHGWRPVHNIPEPVMIRVQIECQRQYGTTPIAIVRRRGGPGNWALCRQLEITQEDAEIICRAMLGRDILGAEADGSVVTCYVGETV